MNEVVANVSVVSIEIIRSNGTREYLGTVSSLKEENDNDSTDQPGKK